jgi:transglycosylase-like protein with SLT domain
VDTHALRGSGSEYLPAVATAHVPRIRVDRRRPGDAASTPGRCRRRRLGIRGRCSGDGRVGRRPVAAVAADAGAAADVAGLIGLSAADAVSRRLPLPMLVAVGQVESNLSSDALSNADARGLLQVLPSTGALLNLDVNRPETNVLAGARYLRLLLDKFRSPDLALAAYNAGPSAVARSGGVPTTGTAAYVARVDQVWRELRGCR